ncbi:MAG: hypothetical protein ACI4VW_00645 [Acutalibacteraceae bacterium]
MKLYDGLINEIKTSFSDAKVLSTGKIPLSVSNINSVILMSDTAFELGGSQKPCVSSLAVSSNIKFSNNVYLLGKDLGEIREDTLFCKFVFIETDDLEDEQESFNRIKELESLRYRISVDGFMTRASVLNMREQIRVSKKSVKSGVGFADYGDVLLKEYMSFPYVKSAEIYFVTDCEDFEKLNCVAKKIGRTTSALNHIFDNIMVDCSSCNLKEICNEVEGMRELHFKSVKSKG